VTLFAHFLLSFRSTRKNLFHTMDYQNRFDTQSYLKGIYSGVDVDPNEAPFLAFFYRRYC